MTGPGTAGTDPTSECRRANPNAPSNVTAPPPPPNPIPPKFRSRNLQKRPHRRISMCVITFTSVSLCGNLRLTLIDVGGCTRASQEIHSRPTNLALELREAIADTAERRIPACDSLRTNDIRPLMNTLLLLSALRSLRAPSDKSERALSLSNPWPPAPALLSFSAFPPRPPRLRGELLAASQVIPSGVVGGSTDF
jgi:hypothetical protein